jgi:molybdate transport system substrate-binding protein
MSQLDAILGWRVFHFWNPERMSYVAIAPDEIPRISYIPISIPVHTRDLELSRSFVEFVLSPAGRSVYERLGYITDLEVARELAPDASVGGEYTLPEEYFDLLEGSPGRR